MSDNGEVTVNNVVSDDFQQIDDELSAKAGADTELATRDKQGLKQEAEQEFEQRSIQKNEQRTNRNETEIAPETKQEAERELQQKRHRELTKNYSGK